MVRALALAGLRCVLVSAREDVARHSRHVVATIDEDRPDLVEALLDHAAAAPEPPVLFVQTDAALLLVSRERARLLGPYRAALPAAELVEDLADKARFQALAERLGLDVPRAAPLAAAGELRFPVVVKPLLREARWQAAFGLAKAVLANDPGELAALEERVRAAGIRAVAQEAVPGPESEV